MEVFHFIRGISAPLISLGTGHRRLSHPPPAQLTTVNHNGAPTGGAVVSAGDGKESGGNWVLKILRVGSFWEERRKKEPGGDEKEEIEDEGDGCSVEEAEAGAKEDGAEFDRVSFSRFLNRVSLAEAEIYADMCYLSELAYRIPEIEKDSLLKYHGLRFVTSSLELKALSQVAEDPTPDQTKSQSETTPERDGIETPDENASGINAYVAYRVAASAAAYLRSRMQSILPLRTQKEEGQDVTCSNEGEADVTRSQGASFVATTNSVTAVIAGDEKMKDAVAKDLSSAHYKPCEWYICDHEKTGTRYFVIQGSESLASWLANLLFEPVQFEGMDVLVHRGIYEAAKGIYQQMLAEIQAHLKSHGDSATFRFTGHSLGGSLAVLVKFMLLVREDAPPSSLLPVITFGAPFIMCGGDHLLRKLGLTHSHVQSVMMHRDIVPRVFACRYPAQVARILKAVNRNFRNHPCLENKCLLYAPMGKLLILQPDEKHSPHHSLLPHGTGLYSTGHHPQEETEDSMEVLSSAHSAFLNSPHPLETLSDRSAYGSEGSIFRDHDIRAYLGSIRGVIRKELRHIRKPKREHDKFMWWPLVSAQAVQSALTIGLNIRPSKLNRH